MSDIVERLRAGGNDFCADGPCWPGDDMLEAAAEITRLRAEVERLREAFAPIVEAMQREIDKGDCALEGGYGGKDTDGVGDYWALALTYGDLRRARDAMGEKG